MNDLTVPARLSWEAWRSRLHEVGTLKKKLPWYIGDLLNFGLDAFGEKAWQEIESLGYSEGALTNMKYVAKKFPPEDRCDLPWSWHAALAPIPKREREKLITQALAGEINRAGIRALAAGNGNGASPTENVPTGTAVAGIAIARAYVTVGKLMERGEKGKLMLDALDELIAAAMAYREKLT